MTDQYDVIIVGAGFGGIGAAIQLKRLGFQNFVLDREDDLAEPGTSTTTPDWRSTFHHHVFVLLRAESELVAAVLHRRRNQAVRR